MLNTPLGILFAFGDAVRSNVCVFALCVYPCDDNPVCDLVACGVAPLSFGGSLQVFCAKLEPGQRDQRVTYTSTASGQAASEHH